MTPRSPTAVAGTRTAVIALAAVLVPTSPLAAAGDPDDAAFDPMAPEHRSVAMSVVETSGDYEEAADYLVVAALELEDANPEKATNLRLAGRLYEHAGETARAHAATLSAGVAAWTSGQPLLAAHVFLDAAELAARLSRPGAVSSAADRAGWVLRHADLDADERASVLTRVRYQPEVRIQLEEAVPVAGSG